MLKHSDFLEVIVPNPSSLACISFEDLQEDYEQLKDGQKTWKDWEQLLIAEILVRLWLSKKWEEAEDFFKDNKLAENLLIEFSKTKPCREQNEIPKCTLTHCPATSHLMGRIQSYLRCDGTIIITVGRQKRPLLIPFKLEETRNLESDVVIVDSSRQLIRNCSWNRNLKVIKQILVDRIVMLDCSFELISRSDEKIGGNSLLLPIAISAFLNDTSNQHIIPLEMIATGGVNESLQVMDVGNLDTKAEFAQSISSKLFVTPKKTRYLIDQIECEGMHIEEVYTQIKEKFKRLSIQKTPSILIPSNTQNDWPKSNFYFKLIYDIDVIPTIESVQKNSLLNTFKRKSESSHFHKFSSNDFYKRFKDAFLFEDSNKTKERIPLVRKINLSLLKQERIKHTHIDISNDSRRKNLVELFEIDVIPLENIGKTKIGLCFKPLEASTIEYKEYHKFITQRRFGSISLLDQKGNKHPGDLTISKLLKGIGSGLNNGKFPSFSEIISSKKESLDKPNIFHYILTQEWNQLQSQDYFKHGLDVLASLNKEIKEQIKTPPTQWQTSDAIDTFHSLHNAGLAVWANGANQFNCDRKPWIVMRSYYFLWLTSIVGRDKELKEVLSTLPHDYPEPRREVMRKCHSFFSAQVI